MQRGCGEARLRANQVEQLACAERARIVGRGIGDGAVADDVIADDHRARSRQFQRPFEIFGIVGLVGVDEDEIERTDFVRLDRWQCFERFAESYFRDAREPGTIDVFARDLCVKRVGFERDQAALGRQSARQPDRAVAAKRSNFENAPCADHAGQHVQKLALRRGNVDLRQARRGVGLERRFKHGIGGQEAVADVVVDLGPKLVVH